MRKFSGVFTAIFTFFLGVSIYFVFLNFALDKSKPLVEPIESSSLPVISLCDATKNPELYLNGNIRVRVRLSGMDGDGYYVRDRGGNCDAKLTFSLAEKSKAEAERLFEQLTAQRSKKYDAYTFTEVEVVGKLEVEVLGKLIYDKYARYVHFQIKTKEIKQLSSVKKLSLKEYHGEQNR